MGKIYGLPSGAMVKNPPANAGDSKDMRLISRLGRFPGERNGYASQCSCLENPMDRGAWWATIHGVAKSRIQLTEQLTLLLFFTYMQY